MWLLVLILSIKLQMSTWYWVLFTIITIIRPFINEPIKYLFCKGFTEAINKTNK